MLIIGDIQVHSRRADPTTAFNRMRDTLKKADLVYANLEGLLVKSVGTDDRHSRQAGVDASGSRRREGAEGRRTSPSSASPTTSRRGATTS